MALTIETGAIVAGANSYVSIAEIDAYHLERLNDVWTDAGLTDAEKTAYLIKATQQLEARYRVLWKGSKRNDNDAVKPQPLAWPRSGVYDEDDYEVDPLSVPLLVKYAQMEVALLLLSESEFVQSEVSPTEVNVSSETVGPISTSYFQPTGSVSTFPMIDQMLEPLTGGVSAVKLGAHIHMTDEEIADMNAEGFDPTDPRWSKWFDI